MLSNPEQLKAMFEMPQVKSILESNPQMKAMMDNPEFLNMMSNPDVINNAMNMMGGQGGQPGSNPFAAGFSQGAQSAFGQPATNTTTTTPTTTSAVDYKEKFKDQLTQMRDMGFPNDDVNLEVLKETNGNVDFAVEKLLSRFN